MIDSQRIQLLNETDVQKGKYILYWMQQAQRAEFNHALEYAVREADKLKLPALAVFGVTQRFPDANIRHYRFMFEGLRETQLSLQKRGIKLVVRLESPRDAAVGLGKDAAMIVTDRGYLRFQKEWRRYVAKRVPCKMAQVETDVVVPVELVSDKEEYGARTIRKKIHSHLGDFLKPLEESRLKRDSLGFRCRSTDLSDLERLMSKLRINRDVKTVRHFCGGAGNAKKLLDQFISNKLSSYAEGRDDPGTDYVSHMSPYLHFGQISPLHVALRVLNAKNTDKKNKDAYIEELIVRRELSMNFCHFNPQYDSFDGLPDWTRRTLKKHGRDKRRYEYSLRQLEQARTHDRYWNAAQKEMALSGKMHNYMRMYWGKKILEWASDPREAYRIALYLNNKYELDGRDPNSFTGVAWCFGKHDRPWGERDIFGTVRYMNAAGLERKFDMDAYVRKVEGLG